MELILERLQLDGDVTIGSLKVDGDFAAWTLEDTVREVDGKPVAQWKVAGETAIPYGRYGVDITMSARFGRLMPILVNVPGFAGIRIHPGNTAADTEGCILVGLDRYSRTVGRSRAAFDLLFAKMRAAKASGDRITIEITKGAS